MISQTLAGFIALVFILFPQTLAAAEQFIVINGVPNAEIVISTQPTRTSKLAAEELRDHIQKISGAELPITSKTTNKVPVKIYVGKSKYTDQLHIYNDGLNFGAFHIVSGQDWLLLLGQDSDFTPPEPWARSYQDQPRMFKEWDKLTGAQWGNPLGTMLHRRYSKKMDLWEYDRRGSLNAVYEFLRSLGVRWYMPGELGEVIPKIETLKIPVINKTVKPDFALRKFHYAFFFQEAEQDILWYLRQGLNHGQEVMGLGPSGHGMRNVHSREEMKKAHPTYYALWNGKRAINRHKNGAACLSSEEHFQENVRYVRAMFDIYDEPMVSVMPQDGYSKLCECKLCLGKDTPERGWEGQISDYVWGYVNRVAKEVYKTHPDKKISCFAYTTYTLPPEKIDKLSPNLVVGIVQSRKHFNNKNKQLHFDELRERWLKKATSPKLLIWDHYPFTLPGRSHEAVPAYFPHLIAKDLHSLKDISKGDFIEVMFDPENGFGLHAPAFNHLNLFVTARLYWDTNQDVEALLDKYYKNFYGPAAKKMKVFIEFCEEQYPTMMSSGEHIDEALTLLAIALEKAGDSIYGMRIKLVTQHVNKLKKLCETDGSVRKQTERYIRKQNNRAKSATLQYKNKL